VPSRSTTDRQAVDRIDRCATTRAPLRKLRRTVRSPSPELREAVQEVAPDRPASDRPSRSHHPYTRDG
jgi:hypothetical protein